MGQVVNKSRGSPKTLRPAATEKTPQRITTTVIPDITKQQNEYNDEMAQRLSSTGGTKRVMVRALYDFDGQDQEDLPFKKGDVMEVLSSMDKSWCRARHARTLKTGYIPCNYVTKDDGRPTSLDAWFNIGRREADRLLLMMGNPMGTYIVRPSSAARSYALSVRYQDVKTDMWVVKHYRIRMTDNNEYFISTRLIMRSVHDLMNYYENNSALCTRLTQACPRKYRPPLQFRDIEVNRASISMLRRLGGGSFGDVWLCKWNNVIQVAVKTLKPGTMDPKRFIEEAELMHRLNHPRIVQLLGVCTREEPVYIITELMSNGALLDFLRRDGNGLKLNDMIDIMAQITEGMAYLESMQFVHRDLRAANILVGDDKEVKVADFGLARITENEDDVYTGDTDTRFPVKWTAPEALQDRLFGIKSDVWSFGILMHEIITYGRTPYLGMNNRTVQYEVLRGYRMPNPHKSNYNVVCPENLYDIMKDCWKENPDDRPTFRHLNDVFDNWSVSTEGQYLEGKEL